MDIKGFAKKLRHAADALEDLNNLSGPSVTYSGEGSYQSMSPKQLKQAIKNIHKTATKYKKRKKHGKYRGTHWMQKPENRERVIAMAKKRAAARKKNREQQS